MERKIIKDLKGKPWERLVWHTIEGIDIQPFYRKEDLDYTQNGINSLPGSFPYRRGNTFNQENNSWQIVQPISSNDPEMARERMEEAMEGNIHAFWIPTGPTFTDLLDRMDLKQTAAHIQTQEDPAVISLDIYTALNKQGVQAESLTGTLENDPISKSISRGQEPSTAHFTRLEAGIKNYHSSPWFRGIGLNFTYLHEQGGTAAQQIAVAISTLVEYLEWRKLTNSSVSLEDILKNISVTFAAGSSFFLELAKLRAFRILYAKVLEAYEIQDPAIHSPFILVQTDKLNQSKYDRHNNLLRTTTATISAVLGGAQAVVVHPFDRVSEEENQLSSRLARNIQNLLKYESYLDKVNDPAGGAYYVEKLTDALGEKAWTLFQHIEQEGGIVDYAKSGSLKRAIEESAEARIKRVAKRKDTLVGINQYPNTGEVLEMDPVDDGRLANPFEILRQRADSWSRQHDRRLKGYLFLFGDVKMRNARSQFARNLIGAGGLEISENSPQESTEESLNKIKEETPDVLVFCSADGEYAQNLPSWIEDLKASQPNLHTIIAGKPENWESMGADDIIFAGMDAVEYLDRLLSKLGA